VNLSPIWGLSLTEGLTKLFEPDTLPLGEAHDDDGVRHQLWMADDPSVIEAISVAVDASPVVIADGHHRYHTARTYRDEQRARRDGRPGDYDLVMALIVELSEEQLVVGPIHRALHGIPSGLDIRSAFDAWFDVVPAGPADDATLRAIAQSEALALVTEGEVWLLSPNEEALDATGSTLDSSVVALAVEGIPGATSSHYHSWEEAVGAVRSNDAQAAVLLRPVKVQQIAEWAHARRRMPPKSTFFTPKPRTGMVFRPLDDAT
jgi:uncharacterized protein (DUF1015 family)